MKVMRSICAAAALAFIVSAAMAQEVRTGLVTQINRLDGTIAIRAIPDGTVGAGGGGPAKQYKVPGASLEALHAGDRVSFSVIQSGGVDTIAKIEKKK